MSAMPPKVPPSVAAAAALARLLTCSSAPRSSSTANGLRVLLAYRPCGSGAQGWEAALVAVPNLLLYPPRPATIT